MNNGRDHFVERKRGFHLEADWVSPVFLHYAILPSRISTLVPFELDLFAGLAWVTLVAFTLKNFRPSVGGRLGRWLFHPFREQRFPNVRTYVRSDGENGIHFLAEWISDWCNAKLGPLLSSLPYRFGRLEYQESARTFRGRVDDPAGRLSFEGFHDTSFAGCRPGTRDEFLLERYLAFNAAGQRLRCFGVLHEPWSQCPAEVAVLEDSLLRKTFPSWQDSRLVCANYSPGAFGVLMGRPQTVQSRRCGAAGRSRVPNLMTVGCDGS